MEMIYKGHQIEWWHSEEDGWNYMVQPEIRGSAGILMKGWNKVSELAVLNAAKGVIDDWIDAQPRTIPDDAKIVIQKDGDEWCALMGENLQVGEAGFGRTPIAALTDLLKPSNKRSGDEQ